MKTLLQQIKLNEDEALDFQELQTILGNRCKNLRVKYTDLQSLNNQYTISDVLPSHVNAGLLLLTARLNSRVNRHWVTLMRHQNGKISFHDPLRLGTHVLSSYMKDKGYFARFIAKNKCDVNSEKHQRNAEMIKTCGLHACTRLVAFSVQDLTNAEYHHWLTSVSLSPDDLVTLITYIGHLSV